MFYEKGDPTGSFFVGILFYECSAYIFKYIDNKAFKIFLFPCII